MHQVMAPHRLPHACFVALMAVALSASAEEPVTVATASSSTYPQQPQVAIDGEGDIHVVFGTKITDTQGSIGYSRSTDGGKTFSEPVQVGRIDGIALGKRRGPRIAIGQDVICVSAISHKDGNIYLYRSTDDGRTWEPGVIVNDAPRSATEGLHAMAASASGELACVWLDHRNERSEVFASISTDGGKSWSKNVLAYRSPDGNVCPCCHPSVAYSANGQIHILWRNDLAGSRDIYHAISSDGGKTFGKARKLGAGSWPIEFCPMDGGNISVSPDGAVTTAWRRDKSVYFCNASESKEVELGSGEQPWLAVSAQGPLVVFLRRRGGPLLLRSMHSLQARQLSESAADPVISSGGSKNEIVVAAWEEFQKGGRQIVCQRID